jgi:uncharacterized membrane protein
MKISSSKYPVDILLCIIVSTVLLPIAMLSMEITIRTLLGLPFILFIPGYILIFALFPAKKTDRGIDVTERIALSFGLSIAIVPLLGLLLNYTPLGIRLEPILLSVFFFNLIIGIIGIYRWKKTDPEERFIISFQLTFPKQKNKVDTALTIILIIAILIVIASLIYVITMPKTGETFTELYILGPTGKATGYPRNLTINENATVLIGITNYENRPINYTIEIWLINQTTITNNQTGSNETHYNHMWYQDSITTTLPYQHINTEESWQPQWTYNYTFAIDTPGENKLAFLLFTTPTATYDTQTDYHEIANEKISSAYRENHLWISVQ